MTTYEHITQVLWPRFGAFILDGIIVSLLATLLSPIFGVTQANSSSSSWVPAFTMIPVSNAHTGFTAVSWFPLLFFVYFFVQEWLFGTTLGKRWMRLRVIDLEGRAITWRAALIRSLTRPFEETLLFGFFLVRFDRLHQRLGDRWGRTLVVGEESLLVPLLSPVQRRQRQRGVVLGLAVFALFCGVFGYFGRPPLVVAGAYNTHTFVFDAPCVVGYTLGAPSWGAGTVTYPVTYTLDHDPSIQGTIELEWAGFPFRQGDPLDGWQARYGVGVSCTTP